MSLLNAGRVPLHQGIQGDAPNPQSNVQSILLKREGIPDYRLKPPDAVSLDPADRQMLGNPVVGFDHVVEEGIARLRWQNTTLPTQSQL